jgi:hypothetical protein
VTAWAVAQGQLYRDLLAAETIAAAPGGTFDSPIYTAPGSVMGPPRDISSRGVLQAFSHRSDNAELVWYVDETSPDNALHLQLGQVPWDVRYGTEDVPAAEGPVRARAQRQLDRPAGPIEVTGLKEIPVTGRIRTLRDVRSVTDCAAHRLPIASEESPVMAGPDTKTASR